MSLSSLALLSIIVSVIPFLVYGFLVSRNVKNEDDLFVASSQLGKKEFFSTMNASWLLLGNVILANVTLGSLYGWMNWWLVLTWLVAFLYFGKHAGRIKDVYGQSRTIHSFLESRLGSKKIKPFAAIATLSNAVSVAALEIIVFMAVARIAIPSPDDIWMVYVLAGLCVGVVCFYTVMGGMLAVARTDMFQLIIVVGGLVAFGGLVIFYSSNAPDEVVRKDLYTFDIRSLFGIGPELVLGIFFLQVPLLFSDFSTWQRLRALRLGDAPSLSVAFTLSGLLNLVLWTIMLGIGIFAAGVVVTETALAGPLADVTRPLLAALTGGSAPAATLSWGANLLFFGACLALIAAMISSADTYLLVAMHTLSADLFGAVDAESAGSYRDETEIVTISRFLGVVVAIVAFAVAALLVSYTANVIEFVFVSFGSLTALAPLTILALACDRSVRNLGRIAEIAFTLSFFPALFYGLWASFVTTDEWHSSSGAYLVPVWAVLASFIVVAVALAVVDRPALKVYLKAFMAKYPERVVPHAD